MEFWIKFEEENIEIQLPVPPPNFRMKTGANNTVVNVNESGEVNLIGNRKLDSIQISTMYPSQDYYFAQTTNRIEPYEFVKIIKQIRDSKKPLRFIITETDINHTMAIESFDYEEKPGGRDIYFDLELKEYRFLKVQSTDKMEKKTAQTENLKERAAQKQIPKEHTVKSGDTLWKISQKYYGTSERYLELAEKNGLNSTTMNKLNIGQKVLLL